VNDREIKLRDGRRLAYAEYGRPGGQPVIHCHGAPSSRVEGNLILDEATVAALGLRVIIPDRPGMGRSDFQTGRQIVDWPADVLELAAALGIDRFAVLGESGGAPYAAACGARIADRVRAVGLVGGVAPFDVPGLFKLMSPALKLTFWLARRAPPVVRGLLSVNLRGLRGADQRRTARIAAQFPEPDRSLLQRPDVRDRFIACFREACREGPRGPAWDMKLIARPWGFDLATVRVPVLLWHGERDGNAPVAHGRYLAGAIPGCRATFYPDEAHLSVPIHHHREILSALAGA
jgi:pimeloyl-ACP methyl ester carboxylesterase